jgi:hypothetical protein
VAVKTVERYATLSYRDGTTRINFYFTDGTSDHYLGLTPDRAHHLLDLLKHEKPVYWTEGPDILWCGREPVGEEETGFDLDDWLNANSRIRDRIAWEEPTGALTTWPTWSQSRKGSLRGAVNGLLAGGGLGISDPPALAYTPGDDENVSTRFSSSTAWGIYVGHVAQSLVAEVARWIPWSLNQLSNAELDLLLGSPSLFQTDGASYRVNFMHGAVTPGDPHAVFQFLVGESLVGSTRRDTMNRTLDWCRANLIHFSGGWEASNVENQWQYRGLPPVSSVIAGTPKTSDGTETIRHRTGGCWGTTGFLRAVLRAVNIPVELVARAGHAQPHFVHESLYLSHGDDPYNAMMRAVPPIPISLLPIDQATHTAWFDAVSSDEARNNIGRRSTKLGLEYLSNWLLRRRCDDQASGASHADSKVYESLDRYWTVVELEAMDLWTRLDAKIVDLGGCGSIPP